VPFSHLWEDPRYPDESDVVYAEIEAGAAIVYLGSTFHFGGANTTADQWRRVVHLSYTLGWLRTEENNYLGTPPSVARQLPPEVQGLIGYSIHDGLEAGGGFLGMVDMHNPLDLLANGSLGA
jgi:ectoine hydroxylase-related dioxygenase (phytanoyl-CoA dioxygenase family)